MSLESEITKNLSDSKKVETARWIKTLLQPNQIIGDLYSINYEYAKVIVHDTYRHSVGGIPSLSF